MKHSFLRIAALISLAAGVLFPAAVQAAKGTPESADFGYGARVDLEGLLCAESIQAASAIHLDWFGLEYDWGNRWLDPSQQPDLSTLDASMQAAALQGTPVLLSLRHAPAWAMGETGPDPVMTAWFVTNLANRYPGMLQAVELFPGANTTAGWGSTPDPAAYAALIANTAAELANTGHSILLPAGGLTPIAPNAPAGDVDDLVFLQGYYAAAGRDLSPLISVRFPVIAGDALTQPGAEHRVLRHYEEVRQVMLENGHTSGILWITQLTTPTSATQGGGMVAQDPDDQSVWLAQAYRQLRAQLYVGVVFFDRLNPPQPTETGQGKSGFSLVKPDLSQHPFFSLLQRLVAQNNRSYGETTQFNEPQIKRIHKDRA